MNMNSPDLPQQFYWIIGVLIVFNIGTIVSSLIGAGRVVWFIAKLESKVVDHEKDLNGFGGRVRKVEERHHDHDKRLSILESKDE